MRFIPALISLAMVFVLETIAAEPSGVPAPVEPALVAAPKAAILGVWKGTSTCTKVEGNELCRDETVVYNVVDVPDKPTTVSLKAARIVDDFIQPMYALYFTYRPDTGQWTSEFKRPANSGVWALTIDGDTLTGTATTLPATKIVRNVVATRTTQDRVLEH
jgi:hypothetical protein